MSDCRWKVLSFHPYPIYPFLPWDKSVHFTFRPHNSVLTRRAPLSSITAAKAKNSAEKKKKLQKPLYTSALYPSPSDLQPLGIRPHTVGTSYVDWNVRLLKSAWHRLFPVHPSRIFNKRICSNRSFWLSWVAAHFTITSVVPKEIQLLLKKFFFLLMYQGKCTIINIEV